MVQSDIVVPEIDITNLINLNQIANKVIEDKTKMKAQIRKLNAIKLKPFRIDMIVKDDLNIVLNKSEIKKQINKDLSLGNYIVATHNNSSLP